jgi:hypothetical protein
MTFVNVLVMLAILGLGMLASMLYYGGRGKKTMRKGFDRVAESVGGTVTQRTRMHDPRLEATLDGRPVSLFVHLSEGHRKTSDLIYLVLSTPVRLPSATLAVEEGYFTAAPDRGSFNEVAGDYLADLLPDRYVYATDEDATRALLTDAAVGKGLTALSRYPQIVLGPDAITVGKPYGGVRDLDPEPMAAELRAVAALAATLERAAADAPAPAAAGA